MTTETDWARRSILATLDEIVQAHHALQLPADALELGEVHAIIARLERHMGKPAAGAAAQ